jgi:hypothetical protein
MILPVYTVGVAGAFLQIAGAQWDVSAHILGIVETFFTPAHTVLYTGIALVALASFYGLLLQSRRVGNGSLSPSLFTGVSIAAVGSALQIIAAPIDFWWHSTYGFDPFLFTPAHSLLIIGMIIGGVGMTLGSVRLLRAQRAGQELADRPRLVPAIVVLALVAVWAQLNFFGYWTTDVTGMAYTFGYCSIQQFRASVPCPFVQQFSAVSFLIASGIFAASGTLVFWTSKSLFHRTGVITSIALILAAIYSAAALGFSAYALRFLNPPGSWYINNATPNEGTRLALFIPIYLLSLIPILVLDLSTKNSVGRNRLLGLSALVGPFAALIDGRYSLGLAQSGIGVFAFVTIPMILGGIVGWVLLTRLAPGLIPNPTIPDIRSTTGGFLSGKRPIKQSHDSEKVESSGRA